MCTCVENLLKCHDMLSDSPDHLATYSTVTYSNPAVTLHCFCVLLLRRHIRLCCIFSFLVYPSLLIMQILSEYSDGNLCMYILVCFATNDILQFVCDISVRDVAFVDVFGEERSCFVAAHFLSGIKLCVCANVCCEVCCLMWGVYNSWKSRKF